MSRFVTALSLIVLLLVPLGWWRGGTRADGLALISPAGKLHAVGVHRGHVLVLMTDIAVRPRGHGGVKWLSSPADGFERMLNVIVSNDISHVNALGVRITSGNAAINLSPAGRRIVILLPPWVPCLIAAGMILAPALKRRPRPGHCATCGYDLRGSHERCPECGTTFDGRGDAAAERSGTSAAGCLGSGGAA